jgi:hypothetical protein
VKEKIMNLGSGFDIIEIPDYSWVTAEQKGRWEKLITALRSGNYKQTNGVLRNRKGFCCLGVATDLVLSEIQETWNWDEKEDAFVLSSNEIGLLPIAVRELYGFRSRSGIGFKTIKSVRYFDFHNSHTLICLNDKGVCFSKIADVLEAALNGGYKKAEELE